MDENIYFEALHIPSDLPVGLKHCEKLFKRLQYGTLNKKNIISSEDVKISATSQTSSLIKPDVLALSKSTVGCSFHHG
jgi:hypothetical protein